MQLKSDPYGIIVSGVGGQGNILIARLLGRVYAAQGFTVSISETFGAAQRGGSVFSSLRISKDRLYGPLPPLGQADLVIGLEPMETLRMLTRFGNPRVAAIANDKPVYPVGVLTGEQDYPDVGELKQAVKELSSASWFVPATDIALELGGPIMANIVMLGALLGTGVTGLEKAQVADDVSRTVPRDKVEVNLKALSRGMEAVG